MWNNVTLGAIVATDERGALGFQGKLPWHLPSELKHFKQLTLGQVLLWGATTFRQFPKALPGRAHLVLSRQQVITQDSALPINCAQSTVHWGADWQELLTMASEQGVKEVWIAGGGSIYELLKDFIDHWHVTTVHTQVPQADCFISLPNWSECQLLEHFPGQERGEPFTWSYHHWRCSISADFK